MAPYLSFTLSDAAALMVTSGAFKAVFFFFLTFTDVDAFLGCDKSASALHEALKEAIMSFIIHCHFTVIHAFIHLIHNGTYILA